MSASNAETWNTTKNVVSGIKWMFTPDAPLLFNPSPEIQKYKWMLGFLWATLKGEHKKNTLETIDIAKKAREIYFKIADEEGIEFELLKKGILRFYDNEKEFMTAGVQYLNGRKNMYQSISNDMPWHEDYLKEHIHVESEDS